LRARLYSYQGTTVLYCCKVCTVKVWSVVRWLRRGRSPPAAHVPHITPPLRCAVQSLSVSTSHRKKRCLCRNVMSLDACQKHSRRLFTWLRIPCPTAPSASAPPPPTYWSAGRSARMPARCRRFRSHQQHTVVDAAHLSPDGARAPSGPTLTVCYIQQMECQSAALPTRELARVGGDRAPRR